MKRIALTLFMLALVGAETHIAHAQAKFGEPDRSQLRQSMYKGCYDAEMEQGQQIVSQDFLNRVCSCAADRSVQYFENDVVLMGAYRSRDNRKVAAQMQSQDASQNLATIKLQCANEYQKVFAKEGKKVSGKASATDTKKGLNGRVRDDFINSATSKCVRAQRAQQANKYLSDVALKDICDCSSSYMADRLSQADLAKIVDQKTTQNYDLHNDAVAVCAKKILK